MNKIRINNIDIEDPNKGLPEDIFLLVTQLTPMINVDLLVIAPEKGTLLSWRDDPISGRGWHIPGGIIRFKEKIEDRIIEVAQHELGSTVIFKPYPTAINEIIHNTRNIRGHFISLLYECILSSSIEVRNIGNNKIKSGDLQWHTHCPDNLIPVHEIYRPYITPINH